MKNSALTEWRTLNLETGETQTVRLARTGRRGRKPTLKSIHTRLAKAVQHPPSRNSVRLMVSGQETAVVAGGAAGVEFTERVEHHGTLLAKRGSLLASEAWPPFGQAARWYADVIQCVPRSGQVVARQLARLCGEDSRVTVPLRSLADAVGRTDSAGRARAYAERGIECLTEAGWLSTETTGAGQNIITTFYLEPGDTGLDWFPEDGDDWAELN
ncbi:hypothetical protein [Aeromicrobium sp. JJY06]|uniref:hypothetical protein n=1 Tax=Aeromicrobium sp. JJY06 TaxID=3373478 RepID=UPI00376F1171